MSKSIEDIITELEAEYERVRDVAQREEPIVTQENGVRGQSPAVKSMIALALALARLKKQIGASTAKPVTKPKLDLNS